MVSPKRSRFRSHSKGSVAALALMAVSAVGCGKAERYQVESAVLSSIYLDRSFFDTVCGFAIDSPVSVRVEIIDVEGDAQPWLGLFGGKPMPGTASIRLTDVVKKGEETKRTCEAKIGFMWTQENKPVTDRRHKVGETTAVFHAQVFKKL
jgi:hypothetical protein